MTKPTGQRWKLFNDNQLTGFDEHIRNLWLNDERPTVMFLGDDRTSTQNTMMFALYGDIARQSQDKSVQDVRRECKLTIGIPILRAASASFSDWYDAGIKKSLDYENKLLLMDHFDVTSDFTVAQATEYIQTILENYTKQGFQLDDPLDAKA